MPLVYRTSSQSSGKLYAAEDLGIENICVAIKMATGACFIVRDWQYSQKKSQGYLPLIMVWKPVKDSFRSAAVSVVQHMEFSAGAAKASDGLSPPSDINITLQVADSSGAVMEGLVCWHVTIARGVLFR